MSYSKIFLSREYQMSKLKITERILSRQIKKMLFKARFLNWTVLHFFLQLLNFYKVCVSNFIFGEFLKLNNFLMSKSINVSCSANIELYIGYECRNFERQIQYLFSSKYWWSKLCSRSANMQSQIQYGYQT